MNAGLRYLNIQREQISSVIIALEKELEEEKERQSLISPPEKLEKRQRFAVGVRSIEARIKYQRKQLSCIERLIKARTSYILDWYTKRDKITSELQLQREKLATIEQRKIELDELYSSKLVILDTEQLKFLQSYYQARRNTTARISLLVNQYQKHLRTKPQESRAKALETKEFFKEIESDIEEQKELLSRSNAEGGIDTHLDTLESLGKVAPVKQIEQLPAEHMKEQSLESLNLETDISFLFKKEDNDEDRGDKEESSDFKGTD